MNAWQITTLADLSVDELRRLRVYFNAKWTPEPTSGCHLWRGAFNSRGYGAFAVQQRARQAHRVAWLLERGPIPDGLVVDHKCQNTACVNPAHLEPVTSGVNVCRGYAAKRIREAGRLPPRRADCLRAFALLTEKRGFPPSIAELTAAMGLRSTHGTVLHLEALERAGLIENRPGEHRSRTVTAAGMKAIGGLR